MKLADYYLRYCESVGEGTLAAPEGIALTENEPLRRAAELQTQIRPWACRNLCAAAPRSRARISRRRFMTHFARRS